MPTMIEQLAMGQNGGGNRTDKWTPTAVYLQLNLALHTALKALKRTRECECAIPC